MRRLAIFGGALLLTACAYNADLGRRQLLIVDDGALTTAAAKAWSQSLAQDPISRDAVANRRVLDVANRIIRAAGLGGQAWEIVVFQNDQANAFVLPGRRMGVNTGLLQVARNDDQLAAVIGHEVAHTVARHAAERYSQTVASSLALAGVQGAIGADTGLGQAVQSFGGAGAQFGILLPFSRRHELEADKIGVDYMKAAGFDPHQAVALWRSMAAQQKTAQPEFASTHPSDSTRIAALEQYIASRGW